MPDISTRINALIAYLFLGPLLLLAKNWTPLAEPYVRWHAKRASLIILMGIVSFIGYRYIKWLIGLSILGFSLEVIILTILVSCTLTALMVWAYRAFNWVTADESTWKSFHMPDNTMDVGTYSEEDKIRIIASFIPFVWILVANKYRTEEIIIWRKVGTLFLILILTNLIFLEGTTTTLALVITLTYIGLIVTTAVYLFGFSRFLSFSFYSMIPTFYEFDAHIKAACITLFSFFRIAFGWEKRSNYSEQYSIYLERNQRIIVPTIEYFAPNWIFAIPGINLITIPSLWQLKYQEYTPLILQWIFLSLLAWSSIMLYGQASQVGLFLLFPIIALIIGSGTNLLTRAPLTSIMIDIYDLFGQGKAKIAAIKENGEEKVGYSYEVENTELKQ
jgi:hypothetical protein